MSKNRATRDPRKGQRADAKNPNNPAQKAAMDNRSNQMNPNNPAYHGSNGGRSGQTKK